ncbi:uncharacterized protein LOC124145316 [Haliotis rufescens]|uniref:uncharacterized protein LOC124145316 n=1 Tax=Haliotis rufescens TaxID=6454 RepID=UPI00201F3CF4|nr:uncharacterized protein LOC124145316 [Haliotis rufescens]XP_046370989.2 uncharacterized protein LOC124145316 [Haliotis rufescens]XP_046370990.2 uncharacterized protein LOC124145316 [Haliotis rufescens]
MTRQILVILLILPSHVYCRIDSEECIRKNPYLFFRWPIFGDLRRDDSTKTGKVLKAADNGLMLDYPPGVESCGGKYPIWRKEKRRSNVSVVCVQNETHTCSTTFEIETRACPNDGEAYRIETNVARSVFCLAPNYCRGKPCANGGTCSSVRDGFTCACRTGYTGRTCEGDPCTVSTRIPEIEKRGPANTILGQVQDSGNLLPGWYDSFNDTRILTKPVIGPACGNTFPYYIREVRGDIAVTCAASRKSDCYFAFMDTPTQNCSDGRQVYRLSSLNGASSYCYDVDTCINNPCMNNGTCEANGGTFTCICQPGFKGTECETECTPKILDLLIIEDISTSVNQSEYEKMKTFVVDAMSKINISSAETNVAFMVFSGTAEVVFHLNTFRDNKASVMAAIGSQTHKGGDTFLGDAIKLATSEVFTETNGDRSVAENVVLLFTDGKSSAGEDVYSSIDELKAKAEVFVVTVTAKSDNTTVDFVASSPALSHVFHIDAPETASSIKNVTTGETCATIPPV